MESRSDMQGRSVPPTPRYDPDRARSRDDEPTSSRASSWARAGENTQREDRIGRAQAWIGIGLGLAGLLMPRKTSQLSGLPDRPTLLRIIGARELASGIGLMADPRSAAWRWARLAGDVMDGAVIGSAFFTPAADRRKLAATVAIVGAIVALDVRAGAASRDTLA